MTTGAANAAIDLQAAADHGVVVCGTGGSPTAAPELTWALLLAFARNLTAEEAALRSGRWQTAVGFELSGKTLGIVGLGKIGTRIAAYGRAFGMDVLAWSQNLTEKPPRRPGPTGSARKNSSQSPTSCPCTCACRRVRRNRRRT